MTAPTATLRTLLFLCVLLTIVLPPFNAFAQWTPDPSANLQVCDVSGEQALPKIAATSDGGTYVCWFDARGGSYAVYLQRLDSLGVKQWAPDGLLISNHPQDTWITDYDMDVDQQDNAVIVFSDIRSGGTFNPVAYKISPQGTFLWGADGIALCDSAEIFQPSPCVRVASDGAAVVTWFFGSSPVRVAMQRLSPEGVKEWGDQPIFLSGTDQENLEYPDLVASDSGSVILLWSGFTGSFLNPQNYRLYTQKFSPAAEPLWGVKPDTVYALGNVPGFFVPKIVPDGLGGALYGWHDDRFMTSLSASFVQHFTSTGARLFPLNGAAVSTLAGRNHFDVSMAYDAATGETFAAWTETNSLQTLVGMYGQKFSPEGNRLWGDDGLALLPLSVNSQAYVNVFALDSSAVILWDDLFSSGVNNAIRAMRLDRQGVRQWGDSVRTLSSAPGEKLHLAAMLDARGLCTLAWGDRRNDMGGIYAQTLHMDGSLGNPPVSVEEPAVPIGSSLLRQCYPNPFNGETRISFTVGTAGAMDRVSVRVFDMLGRSVATLVDGPLAPGSHDVVFDASGFSSGVYVYILQVGTFREAKRMLLLR
jgi:hypothetical protein